MSLLSSFVKWCFSLTPFEIRRRERTPSLPEACFDGIKLVLAYYQAAGRVPTFVQVGACDGFSGDPVHYFVSRGWMRSVLVEPITQSVEKLRKTYYGVDNITILQAAIAEHDGVVQFYKIKDEEAQRNADPNWPLQVSTLNRAHLIKHRVADRNIEEITVPCLTLQSLLAECKLERIDILQVDTEGFDAEVVKMALQLSTPPDCINFEHLHLDFGAINSVFKQLQKNGYSWTHDKWNTLALHKNFIKRLEQREYPKSREVLKS